MYSLIRKSFTPLKRQPGLCWTTRRISSCTTGLSIHGVGIGNCRNQPVRPFASGTSPTGGKRMSNSRREQILSSIRANIPPKRVKHPPIPVFNKLEVDLKSSFQRHLEEAGGAAHEIGSRPEAEAKLASLHSQAQVICSAVPEIPGTRRAETILDPHELADVDVGVVRAQFGVAESGAVWLTQEDLIVNSLGFLLNILWCSSTPKKLWRTCMRPTPVCVWIKQHTA